MLTKTQLSEFLCSLYEFSKSRAIFHTIYIGISLVIGSKVSSIISLSELTPVIGTLQNISAAVFTLAGIWIAYSYPQAISAYTSPNSVKLIPTDETKRIENLVLIVLTSAFVISSLLVYNLLYTSISKMTIPPDLSEYFRVIGASFIFYLSFLQLKAISVVMITNISFVNELHSKRTEKKAHDDL